MIAIAATIFKCNPVIFFVGDKSSLILFLTFSLMLWLIKEMILYYKKKAQFKIRPFNLINRLDYINPASL
jgi:hypothetical protein